MKQKIYNILRDRNLDTSKYNIDILYDAGMMNILNNIEFYYDKTFTCESVIKELFTRGVIEQLKKTQSL